MEARCRPGAALPLRRGRARLNRRCSGALLEWGGENRRDLPWRATRDAWAVLVSEVMLQQTQAARVVPAWGDFLRRFPDATACASASLGDVLRQWQGLGYPRRARDLHNAAGVVADEHGGRVPDDLDALLALPGVGPYTARAVLVFAFERHHGVVDTNVGRLLARWAGEPLSARTAQERADRLVPDERSWDWNQAMFDLGAQVCRARRPRCDRCPVRSACRWSLAGCPEPDPAAGSAATSRPQAPFEGSDRQLRGRLIGAVADGPTSRPELRALLGVAPERVEALVAGLVADGLVVERDGVVELPR